MSNKKVVMFSASWCSPCKQAKPVFQQLKESRSDVQFEIVDIDENRAMAQDFNVTGVPTFMVIENNEEVSRLVGAQNVVRIKELL
jgi:thioredoxin 1